MATAEQRSADARRPMRADARRNCDRLIATARDAFAEKGPDAPLDEIARRAGVGPGTLYRHFPNRTALIEAVYQTDMYGLCELGERLRGELPPDQALEAWLRAQIEFVTHKRGLAVALKAILAEDSTTFELCKNALRETASTLLADAREAGTVRADVEGADLLRLGHAVGVMTEYGTKEEGERVLRVMLDGLRVMTPAAGPSEPDTAPAVD